MVEFEFRTLGTLNLIAPGGRELRSVLAQPKRIALLAYLAAATPRRFHQRDSLLALFWPESDLAHARAALRQALHGLRQALGDDALASRGDDRVGLAETRVWCDANAFDEALDSGRDAEALDLYRGDLLEGFFISGAPEFEHWLEDERALRRRCACEAAWRLAEASRAAGDSALAIHWARRAAALTRDDEASLRRQIALLGELGDRAGAVQAYESFASRLAEEYEVAPAPETTTLIAAVRARETTLTAAGQASSAPASSPVQESLSAREAPAPELPPPIAADAVTSVPRAGRQRIVAIAAVGLLFVITALVWRPPSPYSPRPASLDPRRVVVAEFANRTGDSALDALGLLAAEEITRGLELTDVVQIVDTASTSERARLTRRAGEGHDAAAVRALALATESGLAVSGSISRRGDRIEVAAQVVDERSGRILRALEPVSGDPGNLRPALTVLRDRVMAVVAEAVDPRLGPSASVAGDPPRYDAYLAFSTGVGIFYDGRNGRDALPFFARAAAADSTFALPLIWAAWVNQTLGRCDSTDAIARRLALMRLSHLEQLQLDRQMARCRGDLPAAYAVAHALVDARPESEVWQEQLARDALNFGRPGEAVEILQQLHPDRGALRGRPSYYNWLTNAYHLLGRHDRELEVAAQARAHFPANLAALRTELIALAALGRGSEVTARLREIDPLGPDPIRKKATVMREIALDLAAHGDSGSARIALARTLAWHASQPAAEQSTDYLRFERAQTYFAAGHSDSARAIVAALVRAHPAVEEYVGLAGALAAQRGDTAEAVRMARRLADSARPDGRGRGGATFWRACIAAELGRRDEAVDLLAHALGEGYVFNDLFFLSAHLAPSFATMRAYPPFQDLLRPKA